MKKPKPKKPSKPFPLPDDEDDEEPDEEFKKAYNHIIVGDISVISRAKLTSCENTIKHMLKDKAIGGYLKNNFQTKKLMGTKPSYIE